MLKLKQHPTSQYDNSILTVYAAWLAQIACRKSSLIASYSMQKRIAAYFLNSLPAKGTFMCLYEIEVKNTYLISYYKNAYMYKFALNYMYTCILGELGRIRVKLVQDLHLSTSGPIIAWNVLDIYIYIYYRKLENQYHRGTHYIIPPSEIFGFSCSFSL